jgi:hypothetical protein
MHEMVSGSVVLLLSPFPHIGGPKNLRKSYQFKRNLNSNSMALYILLFIAVKI